jgi:hypothetical protein
MMEKIAQAGEKRGASARLITYKVAVSAPTEREDPPVLSLHYSTLIKKKTKFSSYIRNTRRERLQSHI